MQFVDKQSVARYKYTMKDDIKKYLGLKVKALRENANLTQEDLAIFCDVSWRTISNLERGLVVPDLLMLCRISQYFGTGLDEMLDIKVQNHKSLSRLEKENLVIEKIKSTDDNILDYVADQLNLILKHF